MRWVQTPKILTLSPDDVEKTRRRALLQIADLVASRVRWNVYNEVLALAPRTKDWAARAYDARILIHTNKYIAGIRAQTLGDGAAIRGNVDLMKMLEYGTKNMPARPHIEPTVRSMRKEIGRKAAKAFIDQMLSGKK